MKAKLAINCCLWCDYLTCIHKNHKAKRTHCKIYKAFVKSKAHKAQIKKYLASIDKNN